MANRKGRKEPRKTSASNTSSNSRQYAFTGSPLVMSEFTPSSSSSSKPSKSPARTPTNSTIRKAANTVQPLYNLNYTRPIQDIIGRKKFAKLGQGHDGVAIMASREYLDTLLARKMLARYDSGARPEFREDLVVIKFSLAKDAPEFAREVAFLKLLNAAPETVVGDKTFWAKPYVPTLYFSGVDVVTGLLCMCMSLAPGKMMYKQSNGLSARTMAAVEHATISLWLAGVSHNDLHGGNIVVHETKSKSCVTIIDFGRSTALPSTAVAGVKAALLDLPVASLQHKNPLEQVYAVMAAAIYAMAKNRNVVGYYANSVMLAYHTFHQCMSPECTVEKLAQARRRKWFPKKRRFGVFKLFS